MAIYTDKDSLIEEDTLTFTGGLQIHGLARLGFLDEVNEGLLTEEILLHHFDDNACLLMWNFVLVDPSA